MLGDAAGIGPEICARVLSDRRLSDAARILVIGDARVLELGASQAKLSTEWKAYAAPEDVDWRRGETSLIDGVLSMFHDQGQIATKLKGFQRGVTVTAGLEIPFATPAHGTAFDIVGQGIATTGAFEHAVRLCARLAAARQGKAVGKAARTAS